MAKMTSIDDFMDGSGKEKMKELLNGTSLYVEAVRDLGYTTIGLLVLRDNQSQSYYVSHNEQGLIQDIERRPLGEKNANIHVKAEEGILLEIIQRAEWAQEHPFLAFQKYWSSFHPATLQDLGQFARILTYGITAIARQAVRTVLPTSKA